MMGGAIQVDSVPGRGSTFSFTVSLKTSDPAPRKLAAPRLNALKVLIVDDNAHARDILEGLLKAVGTVAHQVASGVDAIAAVKLADRERPFDLILLDWRMPGMDGIEVARHIKGDKSLRVQPALVIVTAFGREEVNLEAAKAGVERVLLKPVTSSTLLDTLVELFLPERSKVDQLENRSASYDLSGLRILLAEDNKINQQIAVELLQSVGAEVEIANNGNEAVQKLLAKGDDPHIDVVLMDLQMPEVDGYQATAQIKTIPHLATLPIIALTAHALSDERDRCIAAGMRGHISKPIDPDLLYSTLMEFRRGARGQSPTLQKISRQESMLPTISQVDTADGLKRVAGNKRLYRALLQQFADQQADFAAQMRSAEAQRDYITAGRLAHTVKGSAGNLGAKLLSGLADELEKAIRSHDVDNIVPRMTDVISELANTAEAVRRYLNVDNESTSVAVAPRRDVRSLLMKLKQMLTSDDGQSLDYFLEVRGRLGNVISAPELDELQNFVAQFNFAAALNYLAIVTSGHASALELKDDA
jgi:two-component system sensor histidine kinase/response regulator